MTYLEIIIEALHNLLSAHPEMAIFMALAIGFYIGKIHFGSFQLGGVAGSLLAAVIVSQVGISVSPTVQAILFAMFIYAVGYDSGPQFFRSLGRQSLKEIILAATLALTGLLTVVSLAKIFGLDKGIAAGIAAGGLTQSAIIGTASDAISKLPGLTAEAIRTMQTNVATGYAVTYIFGSFGAILICVNFLPFIFRRNIREDAIAAAAEQQKNGAALSPSQQEAITSLVGRIYKVAQGSGMTVSEIEAKSVDYPITIERIKRAGNIIPITPETALVKDDIILLVGRRNTVIEIAGTIGSELNRESGMELQMSTRRVILTNSKYFNKNLHEILLHSDHAIRHGVFLQYLIREGSPVKFDVTTQLKQGDALVLYGLDQDLQRASANIGYTVVQNAKTDFVYMGLGLVVGLLIGLIVVRIGRLPVTLGSGGGALLSGLAFGWFRTRHQSFGALPQGAVQFMKDIGLAGFVVCVGLNSGHTAIKTVMEQGLSIFMIGLVVTVLPLIITMFIGYYILKYRNIAIFAGALSGTRSANPAFGEILNKAGNSIPTVPFAITYALANVFLTLLGPLIVALV